MIIWNFKKAGKCITMTGAIGSQARGYIDGNLNRKKNIEQELDSDGYLKAWNNGFFDRNKNYNHGHTGK